MQTTAPTALWPFNKCPTAVLTATVAITNGHNVVVAVSFETATNPVHFFSRISYVFLLCIAVCFIYLASLSGHLAIDFLIKCGWK